MRTSAVVVAVLSVAVLLASFAPVSWSDAKIEEVKLASVSPWELTLAAKDLPMSDRSDAH